MLLLSFLIGIVAGLRAMLAPAAVAWAASRGALQLEGSWLAIFGWRFTPWVLSLLALGELATDQLPSTPSRKVPVQFGARLFMGGAAGAAVGYGPHSPAIGLLLGLLGAVLGTFGGAAARAAMAAAFARDRPAALIEDVVAVAVAALVVALL